VIAALRPSDVTIQGPSWDGPHIRFARFPVECL
jgi:hypothetical protein